MDMGDKTVVPQSAPAKQTTKKTSTQRSRERRKRKQERARMDATRPQKPGGPMPDPAVYGKFGFMEPLEAKCHACRKPALQRRCPCRSRYYCSPACQRLDWDKHYPEHKVITEVVHDSAAVRCVLGLMTHYQNLYAVNLAAYNMLSIGRRAHHAGGSLFLDVDAPRHDREEVSKGWWKENEADLLTLRRNLEETLVATRLRILYAVYESVSPNNDAIDRPLLMQIHEACEDWSKTNNYLWGGLTPQLLKRAPARASLSHEETGAGDQQAVPSEDATDEPPPAIAFDLLPKVDCPEAFLCDRARGIRRSVLETASWCMFSRDAPRTELADCDPAVV